MITFSPMVFPFGSKNVNMCSIIIISYVFLFVKCFYKLYKKYPAQIELTSIRAGLHRFIYTGWKLILLLLNGIFGLVSLNRVVVYLNAVACKPVVYKLGEITVKQSK